MYIKINNTEYPAEVNGYLHDMAWDGRNTKTIKLAMSHAQAAELFVDGAAWSILEPQEAVDMDESGEATYLLTEGCLEHDNSDYCVAGDIIDHRDGTLTVKMGKLTELEEAYALMFGGDGE